MGLLSRKSESTSQGKATKELIIINRLGLHARPSAMFVKTASRFKCEIWVEKDGERVNGKSIMGLMMLAAGQGSKLWRPQTAFKRWLRCVGASQTPSFLM